MFDKLKYFSFFVLLSVGVFASASEIIDQEFTTRSGSVLLEDRTGSGGEYANLDTVFERVISLGSDCAGKKAINEYFCPQNKWLHTKKGHADLFDWMIIKDYNLLADALSRNLEDLFELEDMTFTHCPVNFKYNMDWNHIAHKTNEEGKWAYGECKVNSYENFIDSFPTIKDKINHLRSKFIDAKNKKTIYFFIEDKRWNENININTLIRLRDSITNIRDGNKDFCIVYSTKDKTFDSFENIIIFSNFSSWFSDHPEYINIFSNFKFTDDIWN